MTEDQKTAEIAGYPEDRERQQIVCRKHSNPKVININSY
jgi:hypothetical protein